MWALGTSGRHFDWNNQNSSFGNPARSKSPVVHEWIADMSMEERKTFVNELFDAFGTGGTQNLSEITAERFAAVLVELNRSSKVTKKIFADLPKKLINDLFKDVKPLPDLLKDVRAPLPDLAELFKGGKKAEKDENGKDEKA